MGKKVLDAFATESEKEVIDTLKIRHNTFRQELSNLILGYGERITSKRFWHTEQEHEARQDYSPHGPLLLQRMNLKIGSGDSGLAVHVDTVDLQNRWRLFPHVIEAGLVPDLVVINHAR
jgi:hypothetical protein